MRTMATNVYPPAIPLVGPDGKARFPITHVDYVIGAAPKLNPRFEGSIILNGIEVFATATDGDGNVVVTPLDPSKGGTGYDNLNDLASAVGRLLGISTTSGSTTTTVVPVAKGGTGAADAATARTNLGITPANIGAAASSHGTHVTYQTTGTPADLGSASLGTATTVARSDHVHAVPSLSNCTGTLGIGKGGTGATSSAAARTNLGITPANIGAAASDHTHALADCSGTLTIAKGGTGQTTAAAALSALGGASVALYNASIPVSWSGNSTDGFTQTVSITGILATDVPVVGVVLSSDKSAATLQGQAFANVNRITTQANSITLYCYTTAPTTAFTLQLLVVRGF